MQHTTLFPRFQQFPALAAETAVSSPSLAAAGLPRWDLSALYVSMDDPALTRDLAEAEKNAKAFAARQLECDIAALEIQSVSGGYSRNRKSVVGVSGRWLFVKEVVFSCRIKSFT